MVHRDIKPENIITLYVTLIDFGYAQDSKKHKNCRRSKETFFSTPKNYS